MPKLLFIFLLSIALSYGASPVWIDCDPSVSRGGHEVDDGFALLQAFHSPEIEVRGVSVVFGNAPLDRAYPIGQKLVSQFGPAGMTVARGAASAAELGTETDASRAIESALAKEKLTLLAIGPATNIATVLRNHPDLASKIERLVAVAGRRPGQHFSTGKAPVPFRDFNFELDPAAFAVILQSRVPLVLAPWEISSHVWLKASDLQAIRRGGTSREELTDAARDWLAVWTKDFGVDGFNPFDTLAVAYATSPSFLDCEPLPVEIRNGPDDAGKKPSKPYLVAARSIPSDSTALYCFNVKPEFKADLMKRLTAGSGWYSSLRTWFFGLGRKYGVNPLIFGAIYVGAIPFFGASIGWLIRNLKTRRSVVLPLLAAGFFFVSAYLYLILAGKNIPPWVYLFIAAMVIFGVISTVRKIRAAVTSS